MDRIFIILIVADPYVHGVMMILRKGLIP